MLEVPRPPSVPPRRVRPRLHSSRPGPRAVALGALLCVLLAGCLIVVLRPAGGDAASPRADVEPGPTTPPSAVAVRSFASDVGDTTACQALSGTEPQLLCPIAGGTVTYTQVTDASARYQRIADARSGPDEHGDGDCSAGRGEERSWSRPEAPGLVAGRYLCVDAGARAELWWIVEDADLLGHATRGDGDLAALFAWWRARAEHP